MVSIIFAPSNWKCWNRPLNTSESLGLRERIDKREAQVAELEQQKAGKKSSEARMQNHQSKMSKALQHTFITKHIVNLFLKNMSENDNPANKHDEDHEA